MVLTGWPTLQLSNWACSTKYEDLPPEVQRESVTLLYDQVGCMIASALLPSCHPVVEMIRAVGGPQECSIIGYPIKASITQSALANGTFGHGAETDSTGKQGTGHYAASAVPTSLTVGQYKNATGRELLRCLAIGAEIAARPQSVMFQFGTRDLFYASITGALGAAVNAGLLLKLNVTQMEQALGLAAFGASGLTSHHREALHQTKSLQRGRASMTGVFSALLASKDYRAPEEILTTENGFFDAFLGASRVGYHVTKGLGETYLMREIAYKRYPVGAPNQTPLYALLSLIRRYNLNADDIKQIEVSLSRGAFDVVTTNQHPSVHMGTILSLAAVFGDVTFEHIYNETYCADPAYLSFRSRVPIIIIPREGMATRGERLNSGLIVRTIRGDVFQQELRYPIMDQEELIQKFRGLVGRRLPDTQVLELEQRLLGIEAEPDVAMLMNQLELPY